jgi:hypothetical protein
MIRLIAIAGFVLAVATPAQAMTPAPIHQQDDVTKVVFGCGPGRTMVNGVCVARIIADFPLHHMLYSGELMRKEFGWLTI